MKYSFEKAIPTGRLIVYSIVLSIIPVLVALAWARSAIASAQQGREALLAIGDRLQKKSAAHEQNRQVLLRFRSKDPLFLHKRLESLSFLSSETALLNKRISRSALPDDAQADKRLRTLSSENVLSFVEGSTDVAANYKETVENQTKPVEVDVQDLATILSALDTSDEPEDPLTPHLIISEARMERKKGFFQETWSLIVKVLRREYA